MRTRPKAPLRPCFGECPADAPCPQCLARDWSIYPRPDLTREEWAIVRQLLWSRVPLVGRPSQPGCERCARPFEDDGPREFTVHHRRHLGMGGNDDCTINGLANLAALCWECHLGTGGAELAPAASRADGWTVVRDAYMPGDRPPELDVPVLLHGRALVWLDPTAAQYRTEPCAA